MGGGSVAELFKTLQLWEKINENQKIQDQCKNIRKMLNEGTGLTKLHILLPVRSENRLTENISHVQIYS